MLRVVLVGCLVVTAAVVDPLAARATRAEDRNGLIVFSYVTLVSFPGDIYVVEPDGSNLRNLSSHPAHDTMPAWSPDGKQIAFISNRDGDAPRFQWDVFVMNADGTGVRNVSRTPGANERTPDWSPDGSKLVFERSGREGPPHIYTINLDASGARRVTNQIGGNPSWSPDGEWIAFDTGNDEGGEDQVFLVKVDGTGLRPLRPGYADDGHPDWSPDGTRIVFSRDEAIVIVGRDGMGLRRLDPDERSYEFPSWSPNGRRLVVIHKGQMYTMDLRGKRLMRVTTLPPGFPGYPDWGATT